jgi:hypothetical protein
LILLFVCQIALQYFELLVRYWRFFESYPQFLGAALSSFTDQRGIQHPRAAHVRSRCCYLLHRLLKPLSDGVKRQLAPFASELLQGLQAMVVAAIQAWPRMTCTSMITPPHTHTHTPSPHPLSFPIAPLA